MNTYDFNKTLKDLNIDQELSIKENCVEIYNNRILREYSNEDLRVLIEENIGLDILIPFALDLLEENILAEGEQYPGDLLDSVVAIDKIYWTAHPDHKSIVKEFIMKNIKKLEDINDRI